MNKTTNNNVISTVNKIMQDVRDKNKKSLSTALMMPLHPDWLFTTNGIYLFIAQPSCGKSDFIIKHILITERLFNPPYYSEIAYCSTTGGMDQTLNAYVDSKQIQSPIVFVKDKFLMKWLNKHLKRKKKYYAMIKYIHNDCKKEFLEKDKIMQHIVTKHNMKFFVQDRTKQRPEYTTDILTQFASSAKSANPANFFPTIVKYNKPKLLNYILAKFDKYKYPKPFVPTLVILDDFASHPLIERKETPLCRMMTKLRHYHTTFIIAVQTPKYVIKNLKRMASDVVIWKGVSFDDFMDLMKEIGHNLNIEECWNTYKALKGDHDSVEVHCKAGRYTVNRTC